MTDYIPQSDADMNVWQGNLVEILETNHIAWGVTTEDFTVIKAKQSTWTTAYAKASNKQNRTAADVVEKDDAGADYKKNIRSFVAEWLANNNKVTDSDRVRMGLTVKSGTHTATAKPTTCPLATVDFSVRRQHTLNFTDEASPRSKAKPEGVHGCEIFMKVGGEAPKSASELTYIATDTSTPYVNIFGGDEAGKEIYYWLRWVNTRGECGPWSSTVSAMVVG